MIMGVFAHTSFKALQVSLENKHSSKTKEKDRVHGLREKNTNENEILNTENVVVDLTSLSKSRD